MVNKELHTALRSITRSASKINDEATENFGSETAIVVKAISANTASTLLVATILMSVKYDLANMNQTIMSLEETVEALNDR